MGVCQAQDLYNLQKRGSNDYTVSAPKPSTGAESSGSGPLTGFNAAKYQSPPYVTPQKIQYAPPQQLNYVVQPTYKYLSQPAAPAPSVSYTPQQVQQQHQYTPQNVAYNTQPLTKVGIPQKVR